MAEVEEKRPQVVIYCGVCGIPPEYCEFNKDQFELCKPWIQKNCPEVYPEIFKEPAEGEKKEGDDEKKEGDGEKKETSEAAPKKSGGKKKKGGDAPAFVNVSIVSRTKRKHITVVAGVDKFGHKLSDVSKAFAKKFSCGASVVKTPTGEEQIDIQGDVLNDIVDFLVEKFKISEDAIVVDEKGRSK